MYVHRGPKEGRTIQQMFNVTKLIKSHTHTHTLTYIIYTIAFYHIVHICNLSNIGCTLINVHFHVVICGNHEDEHIAFNLMRVQCIRRAFLLNRN